MTVLPVAAAVDTWLVAFCVVGVVAVVVDTVFERVRGRQGDRHEAVPADPRVDQGVVVVVLLAALGAVIAGVDFGPTGVGALDVALGFLLLAGVTLALDGSARRGGLVAGVGVFAAAGGFALAGFGHDDDLAAFMAGVVAVALVAGVTGPTAVGRGLRLLAGYGIALGALVVDPVPGAGRPVLTPALLLGLLALDAFVVTTARLRRREPLARPRADHLPDRLRARGWRGGAADAFLVVVQLALSGLAVFSGRAVLAPWAAAVAGALLLLVVGLLVAGADLAPAPSRRVGRWVALGVVVLVVLTLVATIPTALAATDSYDLMEHGRDAAKAGLSAARDGDTAAARRSFESAARQFREARDKLDSPLVTPSLAIPYMASNVRAARTLSSIGTELADAGEAVTAAVQPDALDVVDGRLPLEEIRTITPTLEHGAEVLARATDELETVRSDPYLVPQIRDAVDSVQHQLTKASREAGHAATAAKLAPALFGGDGPRRYLLVVQNNAESRATGGFIGNYGVMTADNGKLDVGRLQRTHDWNEAVAASQPTIDGPADYVARYAQYAPAFTLQNVNLSPDFPTVGKVLMGLAPHAGVGPVDGVMAVDPAGLAALLELTGPVEVEGWPDPITAENVVDISLKQEYLAFAETPERADFLGDVAQAAVDKATAENLGRPPQIAKVLGKAAHEGHIALAFARPEEQKLAEDLGVAGDLGSPAADSLAVTTSNAAANKIDVYLRRTIDAQVHVTPDEAGEQAIVKSEVTVGLANQAPADGLPQIVIGPYDGRFSPGENRAIFSLYSPLRLAGAEIDGAAAALGPQRELGRNVYSTVASIPAGSTKTVTTHLAGEVDLHDGWYSLRIHHQPTYNADDVRLSISVPKSWRIDKAVRAHIDGDQQASAHITLERPTTVRVHIVRSKDASLWDRLNAPD